MRIIGNICPSCILFCGGPDHWAPHFHMNDLLELQRLGLIPKNIYMEYMDSLKHDFIVRSSMVGSVVDYVVRSVYELGHSNDMCHAKPCTVQYEDDGYFLRSKL